MLNTEIVNKVKAALMSIQRRSWEQGECMQAMLEIRDYETLFTLAKEISYARLEDGRVLLMTEWEKGTVTDPCSCGEALMVAAKMTGDRLIKDTYEKLLDYTLNKAFRNKDGILYHLTDKTEFWVDSIYMMPPFLAAAGYPEEAVRQINGYWDALYNPQLKMLNWIYNDVEKKLVRTQIRSICSGYSVVGMVKVASMLPERMKAERDDLLAKAKIVMDWILQYIDDEGVCHDVLADPNSIIGINAVSMVAGAIYRARAMGYLDEEYEKRADHLRQKLHEKVDDYGFLYGVCGVPNNNRTGISSNGQSFFLMMEAAYHDYKTDKPDAWYNAMLYDDGRNRSDYMGVISE